MDHKHQLVVSGDEMRSLKSPVPQHLHHGQLDGCFGTFKDHEKVGRGFAIVDPWNDLLVEVVSGKGA